MKNEVFNKLAKQETDRMLDVMCSKSADYAKNDDKLFNFKQAGRMDNISPIEALRGMWLKHRASIQQGLDELLEGKKSRSRDWWIEKLTDDRNYNLLLFGLLEEQYFIPDGTSPGYEDDFIDRIFGPGTPAIWAVQLIEDNEPEEFEGFTINKSCTDKEWFIRLKNAEYGTLRHLYKDLKLYERLHRNKRDQCYYKTKDEARETIKKYLNKSEEYGEFTIRRPYYHSESGWYVILTDLMGSNYNGTPKFLHKDYKLHTGTDWSGGMGLAEASGYFRDKEHARDTIRAYKNKPVFKVEKLQPHGWYADRIINGHTTYLYPNLKWYHTAMGGSPNYKTGAWHPTKEIAEAYLKAYKEKYDVAR